MFRLILPVLLITYLQVYSQGVSLPYFNNFDNASDTIGWYHYSIVGVDEWEMGQPNGNLFSSANSLFNAWVTNPNGSCNAGSQMILETPFFDLSNTSSNSVLSFYQKNRYSTDPSESSAKLEYSLDSINWFILDDVGAQKKNWQSNQGFPPVYSSLFKHVAIDLGFLQGNDSVKFRFRYSINISNQEGWMIDDFRIDEPYFNVYPSSADTIRGLNNYFPDFEVDLTWVFLNQWEDYYNFTCSYFLSDDPILDPGDQFLGSFNNNIKQTDYSFANTFSMPAGISSGRHYVFYYLDSTNILVENNETDNIGFIVLELDSLYENPYQEYFDSSTTEWNRYIDQNLTNWHWGPPNYFHAEQARSGDNCYYSRESIYNPEALYSPFIDLSNSTNSVLCFYYKHYESQLVYLKTQIANPVAFVGEPTFQSPNLALNVPDSRLYGWDCYCRDISSHDGIQSTKIRMIGPSYNDDNYVFIDDVYIGSAKPDATILIDEAHHYTNSNNNLDSIGYYFMNGGLAGLPTTETKFYYSTDSLLDGSDIYLGSNIEPVMTDTSFVWRSFSFTKPNTSITEFFIIYEADAGNAIDEMHEYDNTGHIKFNQLQNKSLPYFNDFESNVDDWSHFSSIGQDNWIWGEPSGDEIFEAFSGSKGFITSDTGLVDTFSRSHLLTPLFDLTELNNPVMEFKINFTIRDSSLAPYFNARDIRLNIMYSNNGGSTWQTLLPSNDSYKGPYSWFSYNSVTGEDEEELNMLGLNLYKKNQNSFSPTSPSYYGRDYMDPYEVSIDLDAIKNDENIRFMFVFAVGGESCEGTIIDDFEISERKIDLVNITHKNLMISSEDKFIRDHIDIKNNENYISTPTTVRFYLSNDTILQVGQDQLMEEENVPKIRPFKKHYCGLNFPTPQNLQDYNYLLVEVDPLDLNNESNETNNLTWLRLNLDTATHFNYPLLFDFNGDEIDGWCWYNDSTGLMTNNQHNFRFRHKPLGKGGLNNFMDPAYDCMPGTWFMDGFDLIGYGYDWDYLAITSIESPALDFSNTTDVKLEFDFLATGVMSPLSNRQGGNMQYSTDGGQTWTTLTSAMDPNAVNWYNSNDVTSLNGEPGWVNFSTTFSGNLLHAEFNAEFLSGEPYVKFRFNHRGDFRDGGPGPHGFRLDNFFIHGAFIDTLQPIIICSNDTIQIFGSYESQAGFYVDSLQNIQGNDSLVVQELIVNQTFNSVTNETACYGEPYTFPDGSSVQSIENDTVQVSQLSSLNGCDSIIETEISIIQIDTSISENGSDLISNQSSASYQWLVCPDLSPIPNATSQYFTASPDTAYAVEINYNGCLDTSNCITHSSLGINENSIDGFNIYPNPTSGRINIVISDQNEKHNIRITNQLGQLVYSNDEITEREFTIDVPGLPGIYIIEVRKDDEIIGRERIVKN